MFAHAYTLARQFTFPILVSFRQHSGACFSSIAGFVVINEEGWALTAYHVLQQIESLGAAQRSYEDSMAGRLYDQQVEPGAVSHLSVFLGDVGVGIEQAHFLPEVDLAVFRIQGFNSSKLSHYPVFKDPTQQMEPGTSLCKLGFPFHSIQPRYDMAAARFELPPGAYPPPLFPLEGIFTRQVHVAAPHPYPFPLQFIETSSPGLKGQSGGPTFDIYGNVWAIQSRTTSYKLDFGDQHPDQKEAEHLRHQYLNVGWGTHAATIVGFLRSLGIAFRISVP